MPSRPASAAPPPRPKTSPDMFSIRPSVGTLTFSNSRWARRASARATSCGVETMTAPSSGVFCTSVSCTSPVPGGRSTTRMSSGTASVPQRVWVSICVRAWEAIGPRQIMASSALVSRPTDMALRPWMRWGSIMPSRYSGLPDMPSMVGREGPYTSASSSPTDRPRAESAAARLTATVDLPTPPLPLATARTRRTWAGRAVATGAFGRPWSTAWGEREARRGAETFRASAVRTTATLTMPGTAFSAASAASRTGA